MKTAKQKLISVQEAAEMTGVNRQTIVNWMNAGALKGMRKGKSIYIPSNAIKQIMTVNISGLNDEVNKLKEELEAKKAELQQQIRKVDYDVRDLTFSLEHCQFSIRKEVIKRILNIFGEGLSEHEKFIMELFMQGKTSSEIAKMLGVSIYGLRQTFDRGMARLDKTSSYVEENKRLKEENETLKMEHDIMHSAYEKIRKENLELADKIEGYELLNNKIDYNETMSDGQKAILKLLQTPMEEFIISVRTLNALKAAEIETLGQLVRHNKTDLLKFRNIGRKILTELEELVEDKLELYFGMDVNKFIVQTADTIKSKL